MLGRADNERFELYSVEKGRVVIEDPRDINESFGDVFEREKESKTFTTLKSGGVTLLEKGYNYLIGLIGTKGINPDVKLTQWEKDEYRQDERWRVISEVSLDLGSCEFDQDTKTVKVETKVGGLLSDIKSRFDDDYDLLEKEGVEGNVLNDLKTVDVTLEPRQIFRRSRLFVEDGEEVKVIVSGGDTFNARAIPLQVDYNSDQNNISGALGYGLNSVGGTYGTVSSGNIRNLFYFNADRDARIFLNGKVKIEISVQELGFIDLDLVRFNNGGDANFETVIENLGGTPTILGNTIEYTFVDYPIDVEKGDSIALATLSESEDGFRFKVYDTEIVITEDSSYPITTTKAIKPYDAFERLVSLSVGKDTAFKSSIFGAGGKYENIVFTNGFWLRNVPNIINEGEDDERKIQITTSFKSLIEAYGIFEPLMYGVEKIGDKEYFYIEPEKLGQKDFVAIRLGETRNGKFLHTPANDEKRNVLPDNYYSSINIGSSKSGENYEEVAGLYSVCGNAKWNTVNKASKSEYTALTEFRTGSVDVELCRQIQYEQNPDLDSSYDSDSFLIDTKVVNGVHVLKKWGDYYESIPTNVYSPETEYNFNMTPARLLLGHGWKLNAGLYQSANDSIKFISSNCNSSLVTKVTGKDAISEDGRIQHTWLDRPTFTPMQIDFKLYCNQEIIDMLIGETSGFDNKWGLVEFKSEGVLQYGRLIKSDTNKDGKFELIEAVI